jgi:hypothetical protein
MKKIESYPAYAIDQDLRIISLYNGRILRPTDNLRGYLYVSLLWHYDGLKFTRMTMKRVALHRLVCEVYYGPAPEGKPWVNHKNGVKTDNRPENLEWTSISENIQHAYVILGHKAVGGMRGKKHSSITKKKLSETKKGSRHPKFKGWYVYNGKQYGSCAELAEELGIYSMKVYRMYKKGIVQFTPIEA